MSEHSERYSGGATTTLERPVEASTHRRTSVAPIPFTRIAGVELRKMFDTRSGFWMMASIVITSVIASGAVILFGSDADITYDSFAQAIGIPMAIVLPMIAILSVTSEWSQRSGLTTFTLVPHRGRIIGAKAICALVVGVVGMLLAFGIGALGNLLGSAISGVDPVWDADLQQYSMIVLANVIGVMMGFTLGTVIRNSAGAIVGYFVYMFVLPTLSGVLAAYQQWFQDRREWIDFQWMSTRLFDGAYNATDWVQLGVSGLVWMVLPLTIGLAMLLRSEVK